MNKCPNCGTEFDGKFCPNCGSKWEEEKICPQCGAKLGGEARFCNECGYSFVGQPKDGKKVSSAPQNVMQKIYTALGFVPFAALALFSVLLFAFFAAPVAEMVMGMGFPNESLGNVYGYSGFISDIPKLQGSMIALFIFLALSVLYSAAMGAVQFLHKFKYKEIKILNRAFPLPLLMGFAANVFYLIFFIIGIAIISIISSADEGMGLLASGACPILLIVFALLFALLAAGSLVARFLLAKKTPELSKAEEERKNQYIESEKARKEQFYATHNPPVPPVETEGQPKKEYNRSAVIYRHDKRRYDKAIDKKTPEAVIWLETHKKVWIPVLALLLVAVILISVLVPIFTNKFRIGVAEKIQLGYTKDQVVQILGEPYEGGDTDTVWKYYGKEYIAIQDKIKKNNEEQEKAFENGNESSLARLVSEEEKLEEQLKAVTYSYYEISFMPDGENGYSVSSVYFEKNRQDGGEQTEKEVKKVTLSNAGCYDDRTSGTQQVKLIKYDEENPQYCAYFTDGSFFKAYMPATAETETTDGFSVSNDKMELSFKWTDKFASYDFVGEALYIGEVSSNGVWSTSYKQVKSIWLPDSVTSVESMSSTAFEYCPSLESITVSEDNQTYSSQDGVLYNKDKTELIYVPQAKTSVTIPDSVTSIGSYAFDKSLESITVSEDNQTYSSQDGVLYNKDKTELIRVPQAKTSVTIPDSVTSIGSSAFSRCESLTSISIPDSVTSIGSNAFYECTSLTGITIGNGVTSIGSVFYNCTSLTSVTIGNGVTSIDSSAFGNCDSLESITVSDDNRTYSSQDGVLYSKDKTELIRVPQAKISVTIPDSVISIGESAFRGCEILESITIPNSVTSIGESAFSNTAYYNNQDNWKDGVLYIGNCLITATLSGNYEIKSGTKVIADDAFSYCKNLESLTIPDSVTSIGKDAFSGCISLTSITVADGNTAYSSQDGILYNKNKTEIIIVPKAIKGSVTIPNGVTSIDNYTFNDCISLTSITMGSGVTSIGNGAFDGCTSLISITMGSGVTSIGMEAFRGCANLTSITIPDSVTYIGSQAFYNTNIKTATMPALAIYDIPKDNLQSVTITSGNIRYLAFSSCTSLKSVTIGNSVTSIESHAFSSCRNLTSVTVGTGVTSIGDHAFYNCTSLTSITLPFVGNGSDKTYFGYIFGANYSSYNSDYVPSSLKTVVITGGTSIGGFYNCSKLESITIGNGVTEIGYSAFQNCTSLKSVTIGNSVTSIGNNAFQNCTSLESITIPNSVSSIDSYAFQGCTSLESVNFENTAGWKVSTSSDMLEPTEVDVKIPAQNAGYLTGTYNTYHWKRYE